MGTAVRAYLPTKVGKRPQLRPRHRHELALVRAAVPVVDPGPAEQLGGIDVVRWYEYGSWEAEAIENWTRQLEYGTIGIIEGDGNDSVALRARRGLHRGAECNTAVATRHEQCDLPLKTFGRRRELGFPGGTQRVIAEDNDWGQGSFPPCELG